LDLGKKRKSVLEQKILMHFKEKLKTFIHPTIGVGKIVFKSTLSMDEALSTKFYTIKKIPMKALNFINDDLLHALKRRNEINLFSLSIYIRDAAFILRSEI
jgi:hypothetical protein